MNLSRIDISPQKEKQFAKKGILSVEDLSLYFPRKYIDCENITGIQQDTFSVFLAFFTSIKEYDDFFMIRGKEVGENNYVTVTWFKQPYLIPQISKLLNQTVLVAGKTTWNENYKNYSVSAPVVFSSYKKENKKPYSIYSKIPGMSDEYLKTSISEALCECDLFPDPYPTPDFPSYHEALWEIHFPHSNSSLKKAQEKIVYNDLSYFYEEIERRKKEHSDATPFKISNADLSVTIKKNLPYSLTEDQRKVMNSFYTTLKSGKRLNALLQGDVGTGKSIVAFLLMTIFGGNGYQSVLMAPTQVLARQHFEELSSLLSPYGETVLYCGEKGLKKKEKEMVKNGEVKYIVGTHAVLNESIEYNNLALCITDEEHKFGVLQRETLVKSGINTLSMSATPIPRSLATVIYGAGTELFTIKTKPAGRKPVITSHSNSLSHTFSFLKEEIKKGRQAYVVCPAIDKNEEMENILSVEEVTEIYKKNLPGIKIEVLTGRNKKDETEEIIGDFKAGKTDILIATTVIEVGVNVPNASVMVIHNAERFGLAGLHQLRGRVGRGDNQSYCILFSEDKENPRIKVMCETTDGFEIAEQDLILRGAGEIIGLKQSGEDKYVSLMLKFPAIYEKVQENAKAKGVKK